MRYVRVGVLAAMVAAMTTVAAIPGAAQTAPANQGSGTVTAVSGTTESGDSESSAADVPRGLGRWVELQTASFLARYSRIRTVAGVVSRNDLQDSLTLRARFKFDAKGNYGISITGATGNTFTSGWNDTGVGVAKRGSAALYAKQLSFSAVPVRGVEVTAGGIGFERGESSEITTYDNDGYLVGERLAVRRPDRVYLDELMLTNGFLGDLNEPSVFRRYHRLFDRSDYTQVLGHKQVNRSVAVSADLTRQSGVNTVHSAITVGVPRARVVDLFGYEEYRRGGAKPGYGFAAFLEKTIAGRIVPRVGYVDIDPDYVARAGAEATRFGPLNGEKYKAGRRWYAQSDFVLTRDITLWLFVVRALSSPTVTSNRTRFDMVVTFNALGPIQRAGWLR